MLWKNAGSGDETLEDSVARHRGLLSGHRRGVVIKNDQRHVGVFVGSIEQSGDAAVGKGGVANHSDGRMDTGIRSALGHGDRSAHVNGGVNRLIRWQRPEGVTSDIRKNTRHREFGYDVVQEVVAVDVRTALAQLGRTRTH